MVDTTNLGSLMRSQVYEIHPIGEQVAEFCRHLQTQARFPRAARSCQSHEAHILALQEVLNGCSFLLSTNERSQLDRQVVGTAIERFERWEVGRQTHDEQAGTDELDVVNP